MELVCPAGNLPALKVAVDQGANVVYVGFREDNPFLILNGIQTQSALHCKHSHAERHCH